MSIWLADVNGRVVKAIVNKSFPEFVQRIATLFLFAIPSSTVNSALDFLQKRLALSFRKKITCYFHD
jgi:ATP-binding cassette subfamily D (ALD) protein 3